MMNDSRQLNTSVLASSKFVVQTTPQLKKVSRLMSQQKSSSQSFLPTEIAAVDSVILQLQSSTSLKDLNADLQCWLSYISQIEYLEFKRLSISELSLESFIDLWSLDALSLRFSSEKRNIKSTSLIRLCAEAIDFAKLSWLTSKNCTLERTNWRLDVDCYNRFIEVLCTHSDPALLAMSCKLNLDRNQNSIAKKLIEKHQFDAFKRLHQQQAIFLRANEDRYYIYAAAIDEVEFLEYFDKNLGVQHERLEVALRSALKQEAVKSIAYLLADESVCEALDIKSLWKSWSQQPTTHSEILDILISASKTQNLALDTLLTDLLMNKTISEIQRLCDAKLLYLDVRYVQTSSLQSLELPELTTAISKVLQLLSYFDLFHHRLLSQKLSQLIMDSSSSSMMFEIFNQNLEFFKQKESKLTTTSRKRVVRVFRLLQKPIGQDFTVEDLQFLFSKREYELLLTRGLIQSVEELRNLRRIEAEVSLNKPMRRF
jgi:hypothetical protein